MLQKARESLTLILITLLPFHALFVTVVTKVLLGEGHAPLSVLALWKEALLVVIVGFACVEIFRSASAREMRRVDIFDVLLLALIAIAVLLTAMNQEWKHALYGFKYDLFVPAAFLVLRRVSWSEQFRHTLAKSVMIVGGFLALYGLLTLLFPESFFHLLGYSDLHSLYLPNGSLAPFQQIGGLGLRRIQSTMSGPNQFGLWLLIPFSIALCTAWKGEDHLRSPMRTTAETLPQAYRPREYFPYLLLLLLAILFTFSRSAWIAVILILFGFLFLTLPQRVSWSITLSTLIFALLVGTVVGSLAPGVVLRVASSKGHIDRPIQAMETMRANPLGLGLGTAGPASNRFSDACVDVEAGSDLSWAKYHPELCLLSDGRQLKPGNRTCHCPLLTENWYLQIGVELGIAGLILWTLITILMLLKTGRVAITATRRVFNPRLMHRGTQEANQFIIERSAFLMFLGVSVAALFLHAWEDSAVMMTVWVLLALSLSQKGNTR